MNGAEIGVLEQSNKVSLGCLLQCKNSMALETQISLQHTMQFYTSALIYHQTQEHISKQVMKEVATNLKVLGNFTDQPLEGQLPDQKLSTLLVLTDFTARIHKEPKSYYLCSNQLNNFHLLKRKPKGIKPCTILPKSNSSRTVSVWLLHSSGGWGGLTSSLQNSETKKCINK